MNSSLKRCAAAEVNIARPREGLRGRSPPSKQPASGEGLGGLRPPKNNYFHSGVVRYAHDRLR